MKPGHPIAESVDSEGSSWRSAHCSRAHFILPLPQSISHALSSPSRSSSLSAMSPLPIVLFLSPPCLLYPFVPPFFPRSAMSPLPPSLPSLPTFPLSPCLLPLASHSLLVLCPLSHCLLLLPLPWPSLSLLLLFLSCSPAAAEAAHSEMGTPRARTESNQSNNCSVGSAGMEGVLPTRTSTEV